MFKIVQRFFKFQKRMKVLRGSWLNYYRVVINVLIQLQTLNKKILSSLWKEKIEDMHVKYLLNQQSQKFHETLLVFYQTIITTKMIDLIFETIIKEKQKLKFLHILQTTEVYLSSYNKCILITLSTTADANDLRSN